jgi:Na+/proline symporter
MEALRQPIVLGSVVAYMVLCVGVGLWAMRRTRSTKDFFMAGRDLGLLVTGIALFSSTMSGFGFVGGPGLVYALGMSSVWIVIATGLSWAVHDSLAGKRLRLFAGYYDTVSLPDAVAARYGSETARFLTALAILLGVMGYLATQILAMATVMLSILQRTELFAGVGLVTCVAVSTAVLVFYCVTGGVIAGVYTDMVQGGIMVVAGVLVFLTTLTVVDGGMAGATAIILADDPEAIGPWGTIGMIGCVSWFFMFVVGLSGQPHLLTKTMMIKKVRSFRFMPLVTVGGYSLTALLWISIGLVMRAVVVGGMHPPLANADEAAPVFLQQFAHPLLAGVVFAGLFAAIMSTSDGFLNIGAAAVVHDMPVALRGRSLERELLWARTATVILAVAAALFALYSFYQNERLVALLGAFGWGTFGAALVPVVVIGFNWKRATPAAACIAIASSLVVNFSIEVFNIGIPGGIHGGSLALLVSLLLFFGISYLSKPPDLDPDVEKLMNV